MIYEIGPSVYFRDDGKLAPCEYNTWERFVRWIGRRVGSLKHYHEKIPFGVCIHTEPDEDSDSIIATVSMGGAVLDRLGAETESVERIEKI